MLKFADFNPVSLDDRNLFSQDRQFPRVHSDNTFASRVEIHYANREDLAVCRG